MFRATFPHGGGTMKKLGLVGSILVVVGAFFAGGVPAFGDGTDSVTVTASVQAEACITVGTSNINYTTAPFSSGTTLVTRDSSVQDVDSCATAPQTLLVKGTNATGPGANWSLTDVNGNCSAGLSVNQFRHEIGTISGNPLSLRLTTIDRSIGTLLTTHVDMNFATTFTMPCTGSGGAGQTVSSSIIFTATVP